MTYDSRQKWVVDLPDDGENAEAEVIVREMVVTETTYSEEDGYPYGVVFKAIVSAIEDALLLQMEDGQLVVKLGMADCVNEALTNLVFEIKCEAGDS